ncbi:uncharacterized protein CDV56_101747 [Aspergillus thermomutatus]|uniref:Methyltransferase domain-containing protein n=1 Tax=Aspergillus thermomutatus TaxID=41047 RepID=A0A397H8D0_ASPTH|nr:uncharacterized protein CDV56_101747 [Aspergillus thermomutatus]RHZ58919.1 hypothetical protein CDV56_101747 [Aspergillus thermomutatus]
MRSSKPFVTDWSQLRLIWPGLVSECVIQQQLTVSQGPVHWVTSANLRINHQGFWTEFVGFDLLPVLQRPEDPFPPEIKTLVRSVLDHFPEEWNNSFGLVHQRLLLVLFSDEEVTRILHRLVSGVKPGGWIQLFEGSGKRLHDPRAKYFGPSTIWWRGI